MADPNVNIPLYTHGPSQPGGGRLPIAIVVGLLAIIAALLVPLAISARARVSTSDEPRIQPIQDMAQQPRYGPQSPSAVFNDGRAMRSPVSGTVARGRADDDDHYYRGFRTVTDANGNDTTTFLDGFPQRVTLTPELIARGEQRFNIYCAACHGKDGSGNGPIHQRASELVVLHQANWTPPAYLHSDVVRTRPDGHLYNTINVGIRNMPAHGPQIPVADRWAIVAWVRTLQLRQNPPTPAAGKLP